MSKGTRPKGREQLKALCCECGNIRMTTDFDSRGDNTDPEWTVTHVGQEYVRRCIVWRRCTVCGARTKHAYIRNDPDRNEAEVADHLNALPAQLEVFEILNELRARPNVSVFEVIDDDEPAVTVERNLDDDTWEVGIFGTMPIQALSSRLRKAQERIVKPGGERWFMSPASDGGRPNVNVMWLYKEQEPPAR